MHESSRPLLPTAPERLVFCPRMFSSPPYTLCLGDSICPHNVNCAECSNNSRIFPHHVFPHHSSFIMVYRILIFYLHYFISFGSFLHFYLHLLQIQQSIIKTKLMSCISKFLSILSNLNNYYSALNLSHCVDSNLSNNYYLRSLLRTRACAK